MHSVERSPEPGFLAQMRSDHSDWDELNGGDRRRIRDALARDFSSICAYCEQPCQPTRGRDRTEGGEESPLPYEETIDHFRPRSRFPELWLDWLNLVYACYRCNQSKWDSWPTADDIKNRLLAAAHRPRYVPALEFVDPNAADSRRPAQEFFDYDFDSGEIRPAELLDDIEWSTARRTTYDIDLNDDLSDLRSYHPDSLVNQRRYRLYLIIEQIGADPGMRDQVVQSATQPNRPFSSYVAAYFERYFLGLDQSV